MELGGEEGLRQMPDALVGSVVQVFEKRLPTRRQRGRVHGITVILGSDEAKVRPYAAHRLVMAPVSIGKLEGLRSRRQGHQLASEADAEDRAVSLQRLPDMVDGFRADGRIAGTVGQEQPVVVHLREIVVPRHPHDLDVPGNQAAEDVVLDAAIDQDNPLGALAVPDDLLAADGLDQVVFDLPGRLRAAIDDNPPRHHALLPDHPGQSPGHCMLVHTPVEFDNIHN